MAEKLDKSEMVSFRELLMANSIQLDAAVQLLIEKGFFTQDEFLTKLKQVQSQYKNMNQLDNKNYNTANAIVEDIIAEMPLDDRVRVANLDEDGLIVIQLGLGRYLRYLIDKQPATVKEKLMADCIRQSGNEMLDEAVAASYILREIWVRLRETHC